MARATDDPEQEDPFDWIPKETMERLFKKAPLPPGGKLKDLLELSGTLSHEDAEEMMRIIEEEFEQIDPRDWPDVDF